MARYLCEECGQSFKAIDGLTTHLRRDHKVPCERTPGKGRYTGGAYFCCGKQFLTRLIWLDHIGKVHGIFVVYERGILNRRVYLDGVHHQTTQG